MKISTDVLNHYIAVDETGRALRDLLDDVGLEVKRHDADTGRITLELLANRGDHHCYTGLAREISGRTGKSICGPKVTELTTGESPIPLRLNSPLCGVYTATLLERPSTEEAALPDSVIAPLEAAEIHSLNPPVDATNLTNLELGQPTHAFDADTLKGAIVIRESRPGEQAHPLFAEEKVTLPEGTLVIADEEKILAIAGVIGCEESKTTESTTRLLLESAHFDPVAVRKASRALGIHTDSSARFERGSDPTAPLVGAGRVTHLLEAHTTWRRVGQTGVVGDWTDPARSICLSVAAAAAFIGYALTPEEVKDRLERYGFAVQGTGDDLVVRVPPHRIWDVEFDADLYEELAKSIGYNNTPEGLPPVDMGALPTAIETAKSKVEEVLLGQGFYEVFTNGFHGTTMRERLGIDEGHALWAHVQTTNALDRGYGLVKNNALAQAVDAVATNRRVGINPIRMYEWTRTFHPDPQGDNKVCTERDLLWAIAAGNTEDWSGKHQATAPWFMKGLVSEIATILGIPLTVGPTDTAQPLSDALHPGRQATVRLNGAVVGILGEVHPGICARFKLKRCRPVYLEIDRAALISASNQQAYVERSAHQPLQRNLAFTLPLRIEAAQVADIMHDQGPDWLCAIDMVDLFRHEEDGGPVRTVTFELIFENDTGSRSADEVNEICEGLIAAVSAGLGEHGVKLRA